MSSSRDCAIEYLAIDQGLHLVLPPWLRYGFCKCSPQVVGMWFCKSRDCEHLLFREYSGVLE